MFQIFAYLFFIVLADILAARWIVPLAFGLAVPAGVFAVAPIFTLRDGLHKKYGVKVVTILIFIGSIISYLISIFTGNELLGRVTIASIVAFLVSENVDTLVYHLVKKESWMSRVIKSNLVSSLLDSVLFITIAFGFSLSFVLGQYIVKMILATLVGFLYRNKR